MKKKDSFHIFLQSAVKNSGMTRIAIASSIGCSKAAIDKWLTGENTPKIQHLMQLCNLLFGNDANKHYLYASELIYVEKDIKNANSRPTNSNGPTQG